MQQEPAGNEVRDSKQGKKGKAAPVYPNNTMNGQTGINTEGNTIMDTTFNLSELKQGAHEIETATGGKSHLKVRVESTP